MRGAGEKAAKVGQAGRIIPARAGSSGVDVAYASGQADHPRACGEQWSSGPRADSHLGSSPRVRGAAVLANVLT